VVSVEEEVWRLVWGEVGKRDGACLIHAFGSHDMQTHNESRIDVCLSDIEPAMFCGLDEAP
jgi:hypothetical protein